MGLRFVLGSSGAGKSSLMYEEMIEWSLQEPGTRFFIVVPDQFTMQTQKDLVLKHPRGGIWNIDVVSFGRLSHRIFEEVGQNQMMVLDDTGKNLILRRVAQQLSKKLPVIGSNLKKTGYIHEVKSAISELMQYNITPDKMEGLLEYAKPRGALCAKLKDLKTLYCGFLEYIKNKYMTTEESLLILRSVLHKSALLKDSVILLDGFTGFTPIQYQVIEELLRIARQVTVTLVMDASEDPRKMEGEQKLFHLSKKTLADLEKYAKKAGADIEPDCLITGKPCRRFLDNRSLAHLEENLFRYPLRIMEEFQDSIQIFAATNPREEAHQIARKIRKMIREHNLCFRDIAVIAGDLDRYAGYLEEEFHKLSIPCYIDRTTGIVLNPFAEFIKSGLQVLNRNYSYESMFHYLRSGLVDFTKEEIDQLENYVMAAGIKGKKAWNTIFVKRPGKIEETKLAYLNDIRERVMLGLEPLTQKADTAHEHVMALYEFMEAADVANKLSRLEEAFTLNCDYVKAKEYGQIYKLVLMLLEQIAELLGDESISNQEFLEILEAGFQEITVGTIPQSVDRVVVGDIERTRLKEVKAVFFAGVNDGNIPKNVNKGGLISDIDREYLAKSEYELSPSPRQQMYIQRLYLYSNMTKPSRFLIMSFSRSGHDGKAMRPAYLVDLLKKMYPKLIIEVPEQDDVEEQLETKADGWGYLIGLLREYEKGNLSEEQAAFFFGLLEEYNLDKNDKQQLLKLLEAAFYHYRPVPMEKEIASLLYGSILENSVSRLEKFASCAYAHFLQYGLQLKEREEFSFDEMDMGNVFHGVLERFSKKVLEEEKSWLTFSESECREWVEEIVDAYSVEYGETVLFSTAKNKYAIERIKRILKRTVRTLQYQLKKGVFTPSQFEVSFSSMESLESVEVTLSQKEKMRLKGRIDRIDTWETQDKLYVKVIDYKSGHRKFDLVSFYYGLQLQLVVYLNAATQIEKKKHPGKEVIPAAILYYHMADPYVTADTGAMEEAEINRLVQKELRMTGLVNGEEEVVRGLDSEFTDKSDVIPVERKKDGSYHKYSSVIDTQDFFDLSQFVNDKMKELAGRMLDGEIALNPCEQGQTTSCTYCEYSRVCGFDRKLAGHDLRVLEPMGKEEVMEAIKDGITVHTAAKTGH